MSRPRNLTSEQAAAVRSALTALSFEQGEIQIDFDPIDVHVTDLGWITVRNGPCGYEEHENLRAFAAAYALNDPAPELLALAYDMEAMCEYFLLDAVAADDKMGATCWAERRDRCRAAIAASFAKSLRADER